MIVAKLCQRDGLNGFRPLVNLFSNVLTFPQPPPSSVLLTMPGSSRDLHLPLCFLNRCFPLWFFVLLSFFSFFFTCTKHTIDPTSIQTNKSTRTRTRAPQTLYFRFTFSKDLHTSVVMLSDFYFSRSTHFLFRKLIYKRYFTILQVAAENWKKAYIIFHFCTVLYNTITLNTVL